LISEILRRFFTLVKYKKLYPETDILFLEVSLIQWLVSAYYTIIECLIDIFEHTLLTLQLD